MRKLLLVLPLIVGCVHQASNSAKRTPSAEGCAAGFDSLPRTLSVRSPLSVGDTTNFRFSVTNTCNTPVPMRGNGDWPFYAVITDRNGTELWAPYRVVERLPGVILDLKPGQIRCFERDVALITNQGDLVPPGEYIVRAALRKSGLYSPSALKANLVVKPSNVMPPARRGFPGVSDWRTCGARPGYRG